MKHSLYSVFFAGTALVVTSCGGGDSVEPATTHREGFAPDKLTSNLILSPSDFDAGGRILLTNTPARVAHFNSERDENGNYVDGTGGTFQQGQHTFTGNYTYTKCGPNMVELKVVNLRAEPADTVADSHWTVIGHLTFVDEENVIFTGTETKVGSGGGINDPMAFGDAAGGFPGVEGGDGGGRVISP